MGSGSSPFSVETRVPSKDTTEDEKPWSMAFNNLHLFSGENLLMNGFGSTDIPILKGLNNSAQGCEERATLGSQRKRITTLKGLHKLP